MKLAEFQEYLIEIQKVLKASRGTDMGLKALYAITIVSAYKLIMQLGDEPTFKTLNREVAKRGIKVSHDLQVMINQRNNIAHTNDILKSLTILNDISTDVYIDEMDKLIKVVEAKEKYLNQNIDSEATVHTVPQTDDISVKLQTFTTFIYSLMTTSQQKSYGDSTDDVYQYVRDRLNLKNNV